MSGEAEILMKCVSCHDPGVMINTCAKNQGNQGGSCISGVSVLQKVTHKVVIINAMICK